MSECVYPQTNEITIKARNGYTIENPSFQGNTLYVDCVPDKKHECFSEFFIIGGKGAIKCVDNRSGGLTIIWHDGTVWPVEYCPFCGEKA